MVPSVKVVLLGSDVFVNSLLRPYVDLFSTRPPDWQGYLKFYIVPLGGSGLPPWGLKELFGKRCHLEQMFSSLFPFPLRHSCL